MAISCTNFDLWLANWHEEIYRFCLVLVLDTRVAEEMVFQAYLRLGASTPGIDEAEARRVLYSAAFRVSGAHQLKKLRRRPGKKTLCEAFEETSAEPLGTYLRKPLLCKAAAFLLHIASFSPETAGKILGISPSKASRLGNIPNMDAIASACFALRRSENAKSDLSDKLYVRFSERNVAFETRMLDMRHRFDRIVPYLALGVLLLFAFAVYYTSTMH